MRNGINPAKIDSQLSAFKRHRVIIPAYIPALDGYFSHALEILRLSLQSLWHTAETTVSVTVIANQCCPEVLEELRRWSEEGRIDQLVINTRNRGKVDVVTAAARAAFEELITIADCDVMFMPGWVQAVEDMFMHFPECGFVSPFPNPAASQSYTSATILGGLVCGELAYEKVVRDQDLDQFAHSVGRADWFKPKHRRAQMIVRRSGVTACVGGGHFVFTLRKELVDAIPKMPTLQTVGGGRPSLQAPGGGEHLWLDKPPDEAGAWKLSTPRAFAYHLGNTPESWMYQELEKCRSAGPENTRDVALPRLRRRWVSRVPWALRSRFAYRIQELHHRLTTRRSRFAPSLERPTGTIEVRTADDFASYGAGDPRR